MFVKKMHWYFKYTIINNGRANKALNLKCICMINLMNKFILKY